MDCTCKTQCENCKCKKKYLVINMGCDDCTETELELSKEELEFLLKIANKNNENSEYGCQPKIYIYDKYEKKENNFCERGYSYNYYKSKSLTKE